MPLSEFDINFKAARHPEIDAVIEEAGIKRGWFLALARRSSFLLMSPTGMGTHQKLVNPRYNANYLRHVLGQLEPHASEDAHAESCQEIARQPVSRRIMSEEITQFYAGVLADSTRVMDEGYEPGLYLRRDHLGAAGLNRKTIQQREGPGLVLPSDPGHAYSPLLPIVRPVKRRGIAEYATWLVPGGMENLEAVQFSLSGVTTDLFVASERITSLLGG